MHLPTCISYSVHFINNYYRIVPPPRKPSGISQSLSKFSPFSTEGARNGQLNWDFDFAPGALQHPWAGEDLSLKINERDQTIWIYILELQLFHSSQMKSKLASLFFQKSTRWCWAQSKMHQMKKQIPLDKPICHNKQLCLYTPL